jgi:hypothetical protein
LFLEEIAFGKRVQVTGQVNLGRPLTDFIVESAHEVVQQRRGMCDIRTGNACRFNLRISDESHKGIDLAVPARDTGDRGGQLRGACTPERVINRRRCLESLEYLAHIRGGEALDVRIPTMDGEPLALLEGDAPDGISRRGRSVLDQRRWGWGVDAW